MRIGLKEEVLRLIFVHTGGRPENIQCAEEIEAYINQTIRAKSAAYSERLYNEWRTHGKIIIGVDFDCTLSPYETLSNHDDIERTISLLKLCKETGCYIVIHTSCYENRYEEIKNYCGNLSLQFDTINQTPINLPYGQAGSKPYCNIYLDDRACLPHALDQLENALYRYRGYQNGQIKNDDVA